MSLQRFLGNFKSLVNKNYFGLWDAVNLGPVLTSWMDLSDHESPEKKLNDS